MHQAEACRARLAEQVKTARALLQKVVDLDAPNAEDSRDICIALIGLHTEIYDYLLWRF